MKMKTDKGFNLHSLRFVRARINEKRNADDDRAPSLHLNSQCTVVDTTKEFEMKENKKESRTIVRNAIQRYSHLIRTLSLIMTIIMICPLIASAAKIADEESGEDYSVREEVPYEYKPETGDMTLVELKNAKLNAEDIPSEISEEICREREHVNRLYEQEPDGNTVMFQNRDGSKTIYYFSNPVDTPEGNYNDFGGTEAGGASCAAFLIRDKKITISNANKVLAKLGKTNADGKIYDYNIGHTLFWAESINQ